MMPISARKRCMSPVLCAALRSGHGQRRGLAVASRGSCHAVLLDPRASLLKVNVMPARHLAQFSGYTAVCGVYPRSLCRCGHRKRSETTAADAAQVCLSASAGDRYPAVRTTPAGGRRPERCGPGQRMPPRSTRVMRPTRRAPPALVGGRRPAWTAGRPGARTACRAAGARGSRAGGTARAVAPRPSGL